MSGWMAGNVVVDSSDVHVRGEHAWHLAVVERGTPIEGASHDIDREDVEVVPVVEIVVARTA